jgi:hypothetical protein
MFSLTHKLRQRRGFLVVVRPVVRYDRMAGWSSSISICRIPWPSELHNYCQGYSIVPETRSKFEASKHAVLSSDGSLGVAHFSLRYV